MTIAPSHRSLLLSVVLTSLFTSVSFAVPGLTLKDCYERAVKQSERLLQANENILQSQLHRRQALGSVLPHIAWDWSTTIQDTSGVPSDTSGFGSSQLARRRTESKFTLSQPLFGGFKEFGAMSAAEAQRDRDEALLMNTSVNLYLDTAVAFYRALQLEQYLANTRVSIGLTEDRVKELNGRLRLGKSRRSEVLSAESQLASLRSQEAATLGDLVAAREALGFILGEDVQNTPLLDEVQMPTQVDPEDRFLKLALNRSDLRALKDDAVSKRYAIKVARADYYPDIDLKGNYYTQRPGFLSEVDWDASLLVSVPIYQGGTIHALSKEAESRLKQSELELKRGMRLAESEIRQARATLLSTINQTNTLKVSYDKARKSYESQVEEYRLGIVNNLDVLQALNIMQQAKANFDTALLQTKLNVLKLKVVTEEIP